MRNLPLGSMAARLLQHSVLAATALTSLTGCMSPAREMNPSFPVTIESARMDLARMVSDPKPTARAVVIIGGIADPSISSGAMVKVIAPTLSASKVLEVDFFGTTTFAQARAHLLREIRRGLELGETAPIPEVDVVAFSMGGLVARDAASTVHGGERVPIRRLYTIATPHLGARVASAPFQFPQSEDMQITSDFLAQLDEALPDACYELRCYAVTDDVTVGEEFAAPNGWHLWWVPVQPGRYGHLSGFSDERILSDIARRLRGEAGVTLSQGTPIPD